MSGNFAFIPVRGGSKSIPMKNIRPLLGKPLVYWAARAACECGHIDKLYIATDSDVIRACVQGFIAGDPVFAKAEVIGRSPQTATDTASTESALLEFARAHECENVVLIQATSPLLTAEDLNRGFALFALPETESVLSGVREKRFIWHEDRAGYAFPTNYNLLNRPRRQEFDGHLVENGAFYITSRQHLLSSGNRISGRIRMCEMSREAAFDIDEEVDWILIEALMRKGGNVQD